MKGSQKYDMRSYNEFFRAELGWPKGCCQIGWFGCPMLLVAQKADVEFHLYAYFWNSFIKKIWKLILNVCKTFCGIILHHKPAVPGTKESVYFGTYFILVFRVMPLWFLIFPQGNAKKNSETNWFLVMSEARFMNIHHFHFRAANSVFE